MSSHECVFAIMLRMMHVYDIRACVRACARVYGGGSACVSV